MVEVVRTLYDYKGEELGVCYAGNRRNKSLELKTAKDKCIEEFGSFKEDKLKYKTSQVMQVRGVLNANI